MPLKITKFDNPSSLNKWADKIEAALDQLSADSKKHFRSISTIVSSPSVTLPTFQTNEVTNGSQALLDLHAGTNITLTDNKAGKVTIAAAGSSTPTAQWMLSAGIFHFPVVTGGSSNFIDLAFRVAFCRFALPYSLSIGHVDGTMRTALGGGSNIGYAIYDDSKNLVWQSGAFLLTNSANQKLISYATPSVTLSPGSYYLSWSADTVNITTWGLDLTPLVFLSGSSDANIINQGTIPTFGYGSNLSTNASSLTFPSTLGTLNAYAGGVNNFVVPYVFFRP